MPPTRRAKILAVVLAIIVCTIWYLSNDSSSTEFYTRTTAALDKQKASDRETAQKLQEAKDAAIGQEPISFQSPQMPIAVDTPKIAPAPDRVEAATPPGMNGEKSVAGRKTMKGSEVKDVHPGKLAPKVSPSAADKQAQDEVDTGGKEETVKSKEDQEIEIELNSILKKGPIIVFSKSYCPHSAKAKRILLEKYTIVPAPYVVELDIHPMGPGLQNALAKSTGRRTVPNVLISGRSIGGGDDIEALDSSGGLIAKIKTMGAKRIVEAKLT